MGCAVADEADVVAGAAGVGDDRRSPRRHRRGRNGGRRPAPSAGPDRSSGSARRQLGVDDAAGGGQIRASAESRPRAAGVEAAEIAAHQRLQRGIDGGRRGPAVLADVGLSWCDSVTRNARKRSAISRRPRSSCSGLMIDQSRQTATASDPQRSSLDTLQDGCLVERRRISPGRRCARHLEGEGARDVGPGTRG